MSLSTIAIFVSEISILLGVVVPIIVWVVKLVKGMRCQLRSEMLRTYYHNKDKQTIHQYEYENFVYLYEAYHALKGNSFIDKIYEDVQSWEIVK